MSCKEGFCRHFRTGDTIVSAHFEIGLKGKRWANLRNPNHRILFLWGRQRADLPIQFPKPREISGILKNRLTGAVEMVQ